MSLDSVKAFWEQASCGEALYYQGATRAAYDEQRTQRYALEPFIPGFAEFDRCAGVRLLEVGLGLGADHQSVAEGGARCFGLDVTFRSVAHVRRRFQTFGLPCAVQVGNAECLAIKSESMDVVYSWGVLHHTPDTPAAVNEAWRVLKPGGEARVMIYHARSFVGYMLWLRYALGRLRPLTSLSDIYAEHLESPGTKAYTVSEARVLFSRFREVDIRTVLTHGDLLSSEAGQRHRGVVLSFARLMWPRRVIQRFFPDRGLFMLIRAVK